MLSGVFFAVNYTCAVRGFLLFLWLSGLCAVGQQADVDLLQHYFQEGQRALTEERYAEAAQSFEKLRDLDSGIAEIHASLGFCYFQQGKFTEAVPAMREALKLNPALKPVEVLLAMSLAELGSYSQALPGLENGFRSAPDPALRRSAGLRLQRAYSGLEEDDKAVTIALELVRLYPEDPEILYHAGRATGNFAYLTMRKLAEVAGDSVWVHLAAGDAFESQREHALAISEYRKVLALDPGRPGIHYRLGRALLALSQRPNSNGEALREFERELDLDPSNANAAYEAAEIRWKSQDFVRARQLFKLALKFYPEFEEALVGLAKALISLSKPEAALPHLLKAISVNPRSEVAHYRLSQVYRALGNVKGQREAMAEFQRLRSETSPELDTLRKNFLRREVTQQELDSEAVP